MVSNRIFCSGVFYIMMEYLFIMNHLNRQVLKGKKNHFLKVPFSKRKVQKFTNEMEGKDNLEKFECGKFV